VGFERDFWSLDFLRAWLALSTHILWIVIFYTDFFTGTIGLPVLDFHTINGLIYLQVSIGGLANIFITRSKGISWFSKPSLLLFVMFCFAQTAASLIGAFGFPGVPKACQPIRCDSNTTRDMFAQNVENGIIPFGFASNYSLPSNASEPYFLMPDGDTIAFCANRGWDESTIYYQKNIENDYLCDPYNGDILPHLGGCGWGWVLVAWIWCFVWHIPLDAVKIGARTLMKGGVKFSPNHGIKFTKNANNKPPPPVEMAPVVFHSRMSLELMERKAQNGSDSDSTSKSSSGDV